MNNLEQERTFELRQYTIRTNENLVGGELVFLFIFIFHTCFKYSVPFFHNDFSAFFGVSVCLLLTVLAVNLPAMKAYIL